MAGLLVDPPAVVGQRVAPPAAVGQRVAPPVAAGPREDPPVAVGLPREVAAGNCDNPHSPFSFLSKPDPLFHRIFIPHRVIPHPTIFVE